MTFCRTARNSQFPADIGHIMSPPIRFNLYEVNHSSYPIICTQSRLCQNCEAFKQILTTFTMKPTTLHPKAKVSWKSNTVCAFLLFIFYKDVWTNWTLLTMGVDSVVAQGDCMSPCCVKDNTYFATANNWARVVFGFLICTS